MRLAWSVPLVFLLVPGVALGKNPWENWQQCKKSATFMKSAWICDPENLLSKTEAQDLNLALIRFQTDTSCPCANRKLCYPDAGGMRTSYYAVAVIHSEVNKKSALDGADQIFKENAIGTCGNGILILQNPQNKEIQVISGNQSSIYVSDSKIREAVGIANRHSRSGEPADGLKKFLYWYQGQLDFSKDLDRSLIIVIVVCSILGVFIFVICCVICCHTMSKSDPKMKGFPGGQFLEGFQVPPFGLPKSGPPLIWDDTDKKGKKKKKKGKKGRYTEEETYYTVTEPSTIYAPLSNEPLVANGFHPRIPPAMPPPGPPPPGSPFPLGPPMVMHPGFGGHPGGPGHPGFGGPSQMYGHPGGNVPFIISPPPGAYSAYSTEPPSPAAPHRGGGLLLALPAPSPSDNFALRSPSRGYARDNEGIYATIRPLSRSQSETQSLRMFVGDPEPKLTARDRAASDLDMHKAGPSSRRRQSFTDSDEAGKADSVSPQIGYLTTSKDSPSRAKKKQPQVSISTPPPPEIHNGTLNLNPANMMLTNEGKEVKPIDEKQMKKQEEKERKLAEKELKKVEKEAKRRAKERTKEDEKRQREEKEAKRKEEKEKKKSQENEAN